jgi:hypothetical protein
MPILQGHRFCHYLTNQPMSVKGNSLGSEASKNEWRQYWLLPGFKNSAEAKKKNRMQAIPPVFAKFSIIWQN